MYSSETLNAIKIGIPRRIVAHPALNQLSNIRKNATRLSRTGRVSSRDVSLDLNMAETPLMKEEMPINIPKDMKVIPRSLRASEIPNPGKVLSRL